MQLGKYRLIRQLGKGGMGEVWEGRLDGEHGFERRVAIKCMAARGDAFETRFLDEARIASRLHHANIVAVLDYGIADGLPFQVLELVDGLDLQSAIELGKPLPAELALHVCTEVAWALAHAHAACGPDGQSLGIVHVMPALVELASHFLTKR